MIVHLAISQRLLDAYAIRDRFEMHAQLAQRDEIQENVLHRDPLKRVTPSGPRLQQGATR